MGTEKQEELLQIKNLAISFYNKSGEVQAVRGISYTLHKGEVLGIVGESGSGKSVSSHGILRLTPDTGKVKSGEILFHGKDILKMSRKELQELRGNKIAMIFQDPMTSLDPLFTVEYQLNESLKKHTSLDAQARKKRMLELLTLVGINQPERRVKQYPYEFSGGMRQRVMIAMALSCDPELLIADEPTTALDVTIQAQIVEGTSRQIFYERKHPYTEGLLSSVPKLDQKKSEKLKPIKGNPPDMSHVRPGCAFAPRCGCAMQICVKEEAPMCELDDTHKVSCWQVVRHEMEEQKR